jgi:hypothetical protein
MLRARLQLSVAAGTVSQLWAFNWYLHVELRYRPQLLRFTRLPTELSGFTHSSWLKISQSDELLNEISLTDIQFLSSINAFTSISLGIKTHYIHLHSNKQFVSIDVIFMRNQSTDCRCTCIVLT